MLRLLAKIIDFMFMVLVLAMIYTFYFSSTMIVDKTGEPNWILIDAVDAMDEYDIRFKEVVYAQALHETANFTSAIYAECNNLFGMKLAYRRFTTAIKQCRGHAYYESRVECVKDYAVWQKLHLTLYEINVVHKEIQSVEEYLKFLEWAGYAEDSNYIPKLRRYLQNMN